MLLVLDQMFLTVRGAVKGSCKATLGVASVFVHFVFRPVLGAWRYHPLVFCFLRY